MSDNSTQIEEIFERLDVILSEIDKKDTKLKESFDLYKEGVELVKKAGDTLADVEKELIIIKASDVKDGE